MDLHTDLEKMVLAENLYGEFLTGPGPTWEELNEEDQIRWVSVAKYVLTREKKVLQKAGYKRALERNTKRLQKRLEEMKHGN